VARLDPIGFAEPDSEAAIQRCSSDRSLCDELSEASNEVKGVRAFRSLPQCVSSECRLRRDAVDPVVDAVKEAARFDNSGGGVHHPQQRSHEVVADMARREGKGCVSRALLAQGERGSIVKLNFSKS